MVKINSKKSEKLIKCPICQSSGSVRLGKLINKNPQSYSGLMVDIQFNQYLFKCNQCKSAFISPRITNKYSRQLYNIAPDTKWINNKDYSKSTLEELYEKYTPTEFNNIFEKYFKDGDTKKVLDVGCFRGKLLNIFKEYGYDTYGVDLNKLAIDKVSKKHKCLCGEIEVAKKFACKFDVIVAFDLVEHLYKIDDFWNKCKSLLNDNGKVIILTGNPNSIGARIFQNEWWYFNNPEHIIFPSDIYYGSLEEKYGFSCNKVFNVYHRKVYERPIIYKIKMYGLLLISYLKKMITNQPYSNFVKGALSMPGLSPDHLLVILSRSK